MELNDHNCVFLWTNTARARCILNKKFLNLLKEESVSAAVELVYKFDEKSTMNVCKGESIAKI